MKNFIEHYSKDDYTDLLSQIAFSTITSVAHLLTASSLALNFKSIDLDDDEFVDSFLKNGEYMISCLILLDKLPNMIIEESKLLTDQYESLINEALKLFKFPETFISDDGIEQEHQFLVLAIKQIRFRSTIEEMIDGILSGDLQFYELSSKERKNAYNLFAEDFIKPLSDAYLKDELKIYYSHLNCLFDPEETNDMMNYLNHD